MLHSGFLQFKNKLINNLFSAVLLALVYISATAASSIISYNSRNYRSFEKYLHAEGKYMEVASVDIDDSTQSDNLESELRSARVIANYHPYFSLAGPYSDYSVSFLAYDKEVLDIYKPEMSSGKWLKKREWDGNRLHAVTLEGIPGMSVGDTFDISTDSDRIIFVEIVGTMKYDTMIFGHVDGQREDHSDYRRMFMGKNSVYPILTPIIFNQEELIDAASKLGEGTGLGSGMSDIVIVAYDKDISDEDRKYNEDFLSRNVTAIEMENLSRIDHASRRNINNKLAFIVPLLSALISLMFVSVLCSSAISARKQMRNYAIYNVCGMPWRKAIGINVISSILVLIVAVVPAAIVIAAAVIGREVLEVTVMFTFTELLTCIGVTLLFMLCSMLLPIFIIRGSTAVYVLREHS